MGRVIRGGGGEREKALDLTGALAKRRRFPWTREITSGGNGRGGVSWLDWKLSGD